MDFYRNGKMRRKAVDCELLQEKSGDKKFPYYKHRRSGFGGQLLFFSKYGILATKKRGWNEGKTIIMFWECSV